MTRHILIANISARAAAMPDATLRRIFPQMVDLATCNAPACIYGPDGEATRRLSWQVLAAAHRARAKARRSHLPLRAVAAGPDGAA